MENNLLLLGVGFVALLLGTGLGYYIQLLRQGGKTKELEARIGYQEERLQEQQTSYTQRENTLNEQLTEAGAYNEQLRLQHNQLQQDMVRKEAAYKALEEKQQEQQTEVSKLQEKFQKEFENLANKILEKNTDKFSAQNKEQLKTILDPLQEKIQHFEKKVEDTHKESIDRHAALREQIKGLTTLNEQMSKEAVNLTKALKGDSKMQGNWGELVLERVLEKSGLEKGREYEVQQSFTREDGSRVLPDVVIHLPDNKKMVIDSKVSLTAYERLVHSEQEEETEELQKAHLLSIQTHIKQLSEKRYEDLYEMDSPDFVLLFIPIEPAFALALQLDDSLYNKAFQQNIVIVTPTTLLATLRTIDTMWNNDKQQRNAIEIARQAGALYDKFEGLMKDLTGVGKKIDAAKTDYSAAMNKLVEGRGNLITSVEKLKTLGAKAKKALPENILKRAEEEE
ncbi:MAG: DNA recombination protein RmuC [Flavobacteriaceae bacterium]|nr:DNA recombination protein RmuC [Flavobacteriaceae bacterium]